MAAPSIPAAPVAPAHPLARWLAFAAGVFPATLFVSTQTAANAVLPQMQGDLSAGLDQISWVVTASVVAGAIGIPPTGWLEARFGRRRLMGACMIGFSLATLAAGVSPELGSLVFWRAVAAFCGAPVIALSQSQTLDLFAQHERGRAFSFWAIGILCGWIFAPSAGAFISEAFGWRVIFFTLGGLALAGAASSLAVVDTPPRSRGGFDWFGFATLSVGIAGLLLVLNRGQRLDWFESTELVSAAGIGAVSLYVFAVHCATSDRPLVEWRVLKDRNFAFGLVVVFMYASLSLAPLVIIPTMLKAVKGLELLTTGLALVPRGLAQIAGLLLMGPLMARFDPRLLMAAGFALFAGAGFRMAGFDVTLGLDDLFWPNVCQGFAMAMVWAPFASLVYANLEPALRTTGTTVVSLLYSLASSVGVSVSITVLERSVQTSRGDLVAHLVPTNELIRYPVFAAHLDLDERSTLEGLDALVNHQALMIGYVNVFWLLSMVALVVLPCVFALKVPRGH